jgi:hypothetical protein
MIQKPLFFNMWREQKNPYNPQSQPIFYLKIKVAIHPTTYIIIIRHNSILKNHRDQENRIRPLLSRKNNPGNRRIKHEKSTKFNEKVS